MRRPRVADRWQRRGRRGRRRYGHRWQPSAGVSSADINGDGLDDLLIAHQTGDAAVRIDVATSNGAGYGKPVTCYSGGVGAAVADASWLSGDFSGDGRIDAALLVRGAEPGTRTLLVFRHAAKGPGLSAPLTWWTGAVDTSKGPFRAWATDVNGDGRADLLVREDLGSQGLRYSTALSLPAGGGLSTLKTRLVAPTWSPARRWRWSAMPTVTASATCGWSSAAMPQRTPRRTSTCSSPPRAPRPSPARRRGPPRRPTRSRSASSRSRRPTSMPTALATSCCSSRPTPGSRIETLVASYRTLKADVSASDGHDWTAITPY